MATGLLGSMSLRSDEELKNFCCDKSGYDTPIVELIVINDSRHPFHLQVKFPRGVLFLEISIKQKSSNQSTFDLF